MLSKDKLKLLLLIRNRSGNLFSPLSDEILIQGIGGINAKKALDCIINANYKMLFNILSINPLLMFAKANTKNINGDIIETTPLNLAFQLLDKLAWELCYAICEKNKEKHPHIMALYLQEASEIKSHINLQPLFDAYNTYIEQFDMCKDNRISKDTLLSFWLKVGKAQRSILPRHILKCICSLSLRLQTVSYELILLLSENDLDTNTLNEMTKQHDHCPVLVKINPNLYRIYRYNFMNAQWDCYELTKLPFMINFPKVYNMPVFKTMESNPIQRFDLESADYNLYYDSRYISQDVVFSTKENRFEKLFPHSEQSKLGIEFALARGNSAICTAVYNPMGESEFLKYKARDDRNSIKFLVEELIKQKNNFITTITNEHEQMIACASAMNGH